MSHSYALRFISGGSHCAGQQRPGLHNFCFGCLVMSSSERRYLTFCGLCAFLRGVDSNVSSRGKISSFATLGTWSIVFWWKFAVWNDFSHVVWVNLWRNSWKNRNKSIMIEFMNNSAKYLVFSIRFISINFYSSTVCEPLFELWNSCSKRDRKS